MVEMLQYRLDRKLKLNLKGERVPGTSFLRQGFKWLILKIWREESLFHLPLLNKKESIYA